MVDMPYNQTKPKSKKKDYVITSKAAGLEA